MFASHTTPFSGTILAAEGVPTEARMKPLNVLVDIALSIKAYCEKRSFDIITLPAKADRRQLIKVIPRLRSGPTYPSGVDFAISDSRRVSGLGRESGASTRKRQRQNVGREIARGTKREK